MEFAMALQLVEERLDSKFQRIEDRFDSIDRILSTQSDNLHYHINRTNELEARFDPTIKRVSEISEVMLRIKHYTKVLVIIIGLALLGTSASPYIKVLLGLL